MSSDNSLSSIMGTIKMMVILMVVILIFGIIPVIIWSVIKTVLWSMSPWRGGYETTKSDVMKLSFKRMIWTPYTWPMIWTSGWGGMFMAIIYFAADNPDSPVWTEPYMLNALVFIGAAGYLLTVYCMICEVIMIFNFRNWVHNMVDLGHNPL